MMVMDDDVCASLKRLAGVKDCLGWSSGAAATAAYKIAERLGQEKELLQFS